MDSSEMPTPDDNWKKSPGKKKKKYWLQFRVIPGGTKLKTFRDWRPYKKYRSKEEREMALKVLNRNDTLFEYRIPE